MTSILAFVRPGSVARLHGAPLRRHPEPDARAARALRHPLHRRARAGRSEELDQAIAAAENLVDHSHRDARQPDHDDDRHPARRAHAGAALPERPSSWWTTHFSGRPSSIRSNCGADLVLYSATKYLSGFSDMIAGVATQRSRGPDRQDPRQARPCSATSCSPTSAGCSTAACPPSPCA